MRRTLLGVLALALLGGNVRAATVRTIPAAAHVQGQVLFQSDVRVFNPSYTDTITVTAKFYYCDPCGSESDQTFSIAPRHAASYDDVVSSLFNLTGSVYQGALEFDTDANDLVVTSRLYSNSASGSYGQFVPGLEDGNAFPVSVLTSLQQNTDFRTNIVLFNPDDTASVPVTIQLFDGDTGSQIGGDFNVTLPQDGFFKSQPLFSLVGASAATNSNASAKVTTDGVHGIFAGASVLDNHSQDTIFIKGEADQPAPSGLPVASFTFSPSSPAAGQAVQFTDTSTGGPTSWAWSFGDGGTSASQNPSHTYSASGSFTVTLQVSNASGSSSSSTTVPVGAPAVQTIDVSLAQFTYNPTVIVLHAGQSYQLHLHALDNGIGNGHGFSGVSQLGIPSRSNITVGNDFTTSTVTPTAAQVGNYPFHCTTTCGGGHSGMAGTVSVVSP